MSADTSETTTTAVQPQQHLVAILAVEPTRSGVLGRQRAGCVCGWQGPVRLSRWIAEQDAKGHQGTAAPEGAQ